MFPWTTRKNPITYAFLAISLACDPGCLHRYFRKGAANLCGFVELINEEYKPGSGQDGDDDDRTKHRLVPRTEPLPLYTVPEFNEKVKTEVKRDGSTCGFHLLASVRPGLVVVCPSF